MRPNTFVACAVVFVLAAVAAPAFAQGPPSQATPDGGIYAFAAESSR
jgi:hypothetical protein